MEAVSQVVLRNRHRLVPGPLLLVDPAPDALASRLGDDRAVRASSQHCGDFAALAAQGVEARFEPVPEAASTDRTVILRLPREKERFAMILHALADSMHESARLWVVGEKRSGVNSAPTRLSALFTSVTKLDSARHCSLIEATGPAPDRVFRLDDYATAWKWTDKGITLSLCSLPGVFAHGRLDPGTALLLDVLHGLPVSGRVLDFACGNGIVGLSLLAREPGIDLTLLDASALALEATRRSLSLNGLGATVLAANGLPEEASRHDWIVSNPPFHQGVSQDLDVASDFFRRAGTFLHRNGSIVVVFNRHLPYERWARERFDVVDRLAQSRDFTVIQAIRK